MAYQRQEQSVLKRLVLPVCLGSILILSACQVEPTTTTTPTTTTDPVTSPDHKHIIGVEFAGSASGAWPPEALGATNITAIRNYSQQGIQLQSLASSVIVKDRFEKHTGLKSIRGSRYASFEIDIIDDKEVAGKEVENVYARTSYFNYASNLTIDAWIDGSDQIQYRVEPAYITQPPENREEEAKAIELAKADLLSKGYGNVETLIGTAMLAFPSASQVESTGNNFYSERILYATFGQGNGEVPVYKALVNLSQNTVSGSGEVGSY